MQNNDSCSNAPSLVILAAGRGSRFGGDKPMAAVGPNGQSLFEYSVHDAFIAGFKHFVFVVNEQQDTTKFSTPLKIYGDEIKIEFVVQTQVAFVHPDLNRLWSNRIKPWGTAHAVLVCKELIRNPFVVINADDYYGKKNYQRIADYLLAHKQHSDTCALPGYKLERTLSGSGGVNRGVCKVDCNGYLESILEVVNISADRLKTALPDQSNEHYSINGESIVSMTFWGFVPAIFNILENEFHAFLKNTPDSIQDEFYLPDAVNTAIHAGLLHPKVFDSFEQWIGITYAEDVKKVSNAIHKMTEAGEYSNMR